MCRVNSLVIIGSLNNWSCVFYDYKKGPSYIQLIGFPIASVPGSRISSMGNDGNSLANMGIMCLLASVLVVG